MPVRQPPRVSRLVCAIVVALGVLLAPSSDGLGRTAAAAAAPAEPGHAASGSPAAPAVVGTDPAVVAAALDLAVTRFERLLRDRLAFAFGPEASTAYADAAGLRRKLTHLRREALRLGGAEGAELERRLLALRPLLTDLERREAAGEPGNSPVQGPPRHVAGPAPVGSIGAATGIAGTLTLEATGEPIAFQSVYVWTVSGFFAGSGPTDASGHYQVTGLAPGTYFANTVVNSGSGLLDELYGNIACSSGFCDVTEGAPIVVQTGTVTMGIDFAIVAGATIAGAVNDADTGDPIGFAEIVIFDENGALLGDAFTDSSGHFEVSGLGDGNVFARARHDQFSRELYDHLPCDSSFEPTTGTPIAVTAGTTITGIDFSLEGRSALAGRMTEMGGAPVPFEEVVGLYPQGGLAGFGLTDALGDYEIGGLTAGAYVVQTAAVGWLNELYDNIPCHPFCDVTTGTPVEVTANTTTPGIDLELQRLGRITGRVEDSLTGTAVPGVILRAFDGFGENVAATGTDGSGDYELGFLSAGSYFVTAALFTHRGELYDDIACHLGFPPACDPTIGTPVAVQLDAVTSDIDFALDPRGTIRGTVSETGTGMPLEGLQVDAWDVNGIQTAVGSTDSAGQYELVGLDPGNHFVTVTSFTHSSELYDDLPCPGGPPAGCDPSTGTPLAVVIGSEITGIDFALDLRGRIAGQATDEASGLPVVSGAVAVWDSAGELASRAETDGNGLYLAEGLDTGTYFVTAGSFEHARELYDDIPCPFVPPGCDPTTGIPVPVVLGATTPGIDFDLTVRGSVHGQVTEEATGQPLPGTRLYLFRETGTTARFALAGAGGFYSFTALDPGTYFVIAADGPEEIAELYDDIPCIDLLCDPTIGTPVPVTDGVATTGIDFDLPSIVLFFADGFESGDTSTWTGTVE